MRMRFLLPALAALALSACATSRPSMSYVASEVTASDASTLVADAVDFLADSLPPAKTTLLLDPPAVRQGTVPDVLTPAMTDRLRARGYGVAVVADDRPAAPDKRATPLRYLVSPLDNGIVLRLQFNGQEATKLYPRTTAGTLLTSGPFLLREVGQ